jgi:hypothetical protein
MVYPARVTATIVRVKRLVQYFERERARRSRLDPESGAIACSLRCRFGGELGGRSVSVIGSTPARVITSQRVIGSTSP